jgi:curved DNA-binding protein CbpA
MLRSVGRRLSTTAAARRVLGLPAVGVTSASDLKAAFRRRAFETHPDRGGSSERFREVSQAYTNLARHLREQSHESDSSAPEKGGVPKDWSPTEAEFEEEFQKWNRQRMEVRTRGMGYAPGS